MVRLRTVPFPLRQKVEQELERLEQEGVVEPVTFLDWAAPIVPVMKGDGGVRICGDYKLTVNKVAKLEVYPLPRIDELFASLSGGQTFKQGLKKLTEGSLETRLARFLFSYRTTPQSTTGQSPAELLFGRPLRTQLDLLQPDLRAKVQCQQERMKINHDQHARQRGFSIGDQVFVRNYGQGPLWMPGVISEVRRPVSYVVTLEDGRVMRRHVDLLRPRWTHPPEEVVLDTAPPDLEAPVPVQPTVADLEPVVPDDTTPTTATETNRDNATDTVSEPPRLRRSNRQRRPPDRFGW